MHLRTHILADGPTYKLTAYLAERKRSSSSSSNFYLKPTSRRTDRECLAAAAAAASCFSDSTSSSSPCVLSSTVKLNSLSPFFFPSSVVPFRSFAIWNSRGKTDISQRKSRDVIREMKNKRKLKKRQGREGGREGREIQGGKRAGLSKQAVLEKWESVGCLEEDCYRVFVHLSLSFFFFSFALMSFSSSSSSSVSEKK